MTVPAPLRFAVFTDLHVAPPGTADARWNNPVRLSESRGLLQAAVADAARTGVDHVVVLGDAADGGDEVSAAVALKASAGAGVPVWAVPGNHDVAAGDD